MDELARLMGFLAAHGVWNLSDGGALLPFVGWERADGQRGHDRLVVANSAEAVARARELVEANSWEATMAALVFDAYITLPDGRADALMVEGRRYGAAPLTLGLVVPYRPAEAPGGFGVHTPRFNGVKGGDGEPDYEQLRQAVFNGVNSHEQAAQVWAAHLDLSR
ncbi:MAG: hypothetical protein OEY41_10795 [Acidimicrobiia bacterium]|nr:hypothetical protein [Acidimicrobiia bacterium]MDH5290473.1 hypothetical protein [Acidimicrobiia bacterium]